jgi:hypothetical protein
MTTDEKEILEAYKSYVRAFQAFDPLAVLPFYHVPCMRISSKGVSMMNDSEEIKSHFTHILKDLKTRNYARSEISDLYIKTLNERIALLSMRAARYRADGGELERVGASYTLCKKGTSWKIAAIMIHDPDAVVRMS